MTAWQCGGQGFESPQLHAIDQAVSPPEGRPESFPASTVASTLPCGLVYSRGTLSPARSAWTPDEDPRSCVRVPGSWKPSFMAGDGLRPVRRPVSLNGPLRDGPDRRSPVTFDQDATVPVSVLPGGPLSSRYGAAWAYFER
jgi:hypothetical protein